MAISNAVSFSFRQNLAANGLRLTNSRKAIFKVLVESRPLTFSELLAKTERMTDRVSVYRNIALFEQLGIVNRIKVGWKYKLELSDSYGVHHHHLICIKCGRIFDIAEDQHINDFIKAISQDHAFVPRYHSFEIEGYCRSCAEPVQRTSDIN